MSNILCENCLFDGWVISEKSFEKENMFLNSNLFKIGNGYINMPDGYEERIYCVKNYTEEGTYISGFYDLYSYESNEQCSLKKHIVNVDEGKSISLYIEDEEFNMLKGVILEYKRSLDLRTGVLCRNLIWESSNGKRVGLNIKRMTSLNNKHLAAISYEVIPLNFTGKIRIVSSLCAQQKLNTFEKKLCDNKGLITSETLNTKFKLASGMENTISGEKDFTYKTMEDNNKLDIVYDFTGKVNKKIKLDKFIVYFISKGYDEQNLKSKVEQELANAKKQGFASIERKQKKFLNNFWSYVNLKANKDKNILNQIKLNEFSMLQTYGKSYI